MTELRNSAAPRTDVGGPLVNESVRYAAADVSIAIPTFGRDAVLLDTIQSCLEQTPPAGEILVVDQTPLHASSTEQTRADWHGSGRIRLHVSPIPRSLKRW